MLLVWGDEDCIQNFVGETSWFKRSLGRPRRRSESNIKMEVGKIGCEDGEDG
jgi:hypothetical protein